MRLQPTLSLILKSLLPLYAQVPAWQWARSGTGTFNDQVYAATFIPAPTPRVAIGGEFYSYTLNLGGISLTGPAGGPFSSYAFLAVYDTQGNLLWATSAGQSDPNRITALASDTTGHIIAVGSFTGSTIAFGNVSLSNVGYADAFVVKYDPTGTPLWALSIAGSSWEEATSVATDSSGNIYLTGSFESPTLTVGPFQLQNASSTGTKDIFLIKLSPQGQVLWAQAFGGPDNDGSQAIAISPTNEIAITGFFNSPSLSIGSTTLSTVGRGDLFIAKFDPNSQPLWAKSAGGPDYELPYSIAFTPNGHIVAVGTFWSSSLTFDHQTCPLQGSNDLFIAMYSPTGQLLWVRCVGGSDSEEAAAVTTDTSGHIYVTGYFASSTVTFGGQTLQTSGDGDIFVVAYDSNGQVRWTQKASGSLYDKAYALAIDPQGHLYVGGAYTSNPLTFGSIPLANDQAYDAFIAKLGPATGTSIPFSSSAIRLIPLSEAGKYQIQAVGLPLPLRWHLYTVWGTPVRSGLLQKPEDSLDFSDLPNGVYGLRIDWPPAPQVWKILR